MRALGWLIPLVLAAGAVAAQAPVAPDTSRATVLTGRVRDPFGHPLHAATVATDLGTTAIVDDSGRFDLRNLPPGKNHFTVMRIGYAPVAFDIEMPGDTTVFVDVHLTPVTTLAPVSTVGKGLNARLDREGYYARKKASFGYFISPEVVVSRPLGYASQQLYDVPNTTLIKRAHDSGYDVMLGSPGHWCTPAIFVDGTYLSRLSLDEAVSGAQVYALEVYTSAGTIPPRFQATYVNGDTMCAAIAVWTKAGAAR